MSEPLDIEEELEEGRKPGNQTFFKNDTNNLLVVTRGHPFERDNFFNCRRGFSAASCRRASAVK